MTVSPPLNPVLMVLEGSGSLAGRDRSGAFTATGSGALRYAPAPGARVNLCVNPSVEVNLNAWTPQVAGTSYSRVADSSAFGSWICRVVNDGSNAIQGLGVIAYYPYVPGDQVSGSISVRGPVGETITIWLRSNDGSSNTSGAQKTIAFTGGWQRITALTHTIPASGALYVQLFVRKNEATPLTFDADGAMIERGISDGTYFDGSQAGCVWLDPITGQLGIANSSPSGSRAVFWVEEATTNIFPNPIFANDTGFMGATTNCVMTRDLTRAYIGAASLKFVTAGLGAQEGVVATLSGLSLTGAANPYTASVLLSGSGTVNIWVRITYSDATITTDVFTSVVLTNGWQKSTTVTLTLDPAKTVTIIQVHIRTPSASVVTGYVGFVQIEQKAYATSPCVGSLGTGYSWAGTAHASASSRAVTRISVSSAGRLDIASGELVSRHLIDYSGPSQFAFGHVGAGSDRLYLYRSASGLMTAAFGQSASWAVDPVTLANNVKWIGSLAWANNVGYFYRASTLLHSAAITLSNLASIIDFGSRGSDGPLDGRIGPVAIYDKPLSDTRRALVNTAIDSNGSIDLWTLFEEWEAIGQPADLLALQSGQATAGVKVEAQPLELLALQDGAASYSWHPAGISGVPTVAPLLSAILTTGVDMTTAFEQNTVGVWLTHLVHEIVGPLKDNADVTYTVYRADGSTHTNGELTYFDGAGWHVSFDAPELDPGASERLRIVVRAETPGAVRDFRSYVTVKDLGAN